MDKKKRVWAFILALALIAATAAFVLNIRSSKVSDSPILYLNLNFDDVNDLSALDLLPIDENQPNLIPGAEFIQNGALRLGSENSLRAFNFKHDAPPGRIAHVRMRAAEESPCSCFEFYHPQETNYSSIRLNNCPNDAIQVSAMVSWNDGKTEELPIKSEGVLEINPDEWIDLIFWLHPEGDKLFYVGGNETNPDIFLYGAVSLPPNWQSESWGMSFGGFFGGIEAKDSPFLPIDVDFVHLSSGDISNYLRYYFPAYLNHQDQLDEFLNSEPPLLNMSNTALMLPNDSASAPTTTA